MPARNSEFIKGEDLRRLRNLKGLKQSAVAAQLGISRQAYSKTECSQNVNTNLAGKVLAVFNYTFTDLESLKKNYP